MKKLIVFLLVASFYSCTDDSDCQTCRAEALGITVKTEYCQDGSDVIQTIAGVKTTIPNTTVAEVVKSVSQVPNTTCE